MEFPSDIITDDVIELYLVDLDKKYPAKGVLYGRFAKFYESIKNKTIKNYISKDNLIKFTGRGGFYVAYSISAKQWYFQPGGLH